MSRALLDEAVDHLATYAEADERAHELSLRLAMAAAGIEEAWPRCGEGERVEWVNPDTDTAVVAEEDGEGWNVARFGPGEREPRAADSVESLTEAAAYAKTWLM